MRIKLDDREGKQRGRRQRRSRRHRGWSFEASAARSQMQTRRKSQPRQSQPGEDTHQGQPPSAPAVPGAQVAERQPIRVLTVVVRALAALILVGLIAAIVYTSTAQSFFVYSAQILGSHYLESDSIYEAARVHEQNIFWIQPERVAERVRGLDGIKTVQVHSHLPAQVIIEVEERLPAVLWRAESQGQDWWLDENGMVLPYHGVVTDTVFVVDSSERDLKIGDHIEPEGIVHSVLELARAVPGTRIFYYQSESGLSFPQKTSLGQWPVYVGDSENLAHKLQVLQAMTDHLVAQKIRPRFVDVRWADHPVYGKPDGKATRRSE